MKIRIILLTITLIISNLSFSQADSLIGKEVTIQLNKTKNTVTGVYKNYKNNRVTVLFDNSLHDYFYPEIKLLEFEELNFSFTENGELIPIKSPIVLESNTLLSLFKKKKQSTKEKRLIQSKKKKHLQHK